jgi:hypothetical protein
MHPSLIMMMNKFTHFSISSRMCLCNAGQFISKGGIGPPMSQLYGWGAGGDDCYCIDVCALCHGFPGLCKIGQLHMAALLVPGQSEPNLD